MPSTDFPQFVIMICQQIPSDFTFFLHLPTTQSRFLSPPHTNLCGRLWEMGSTRPAVQRLPCMAIYRETLFLNYLHNWLWFCISDDSWSLQGSPPFTNKIAAGLCMMHSYPCSLQNPDRMPLGAFCNHIDSVKVLFLENHKLKQFKRVWGSIHQLSTVCRSENPKQKLIQEVPEDQK